MHLLYNIACVIYTYSHKNITYLSLVNEMVSMNHSLWNLISTEFEELFSKKVETDSPHSTTHVNTSCRVELLRTFCRYSINSVSQQHKMQTDHVPKKITIYIYIYIYIYIIVIIYIYILI